MKGTLARAGHRLVAVTKAADGWQKLRELVKFDLIFSEVKLAEQNGLSFLAQLRADPFLKHVPVVFYTSVMEQATVKKALELKVQNYLAKPYHDNAIYAEITKALANPWRGQLFEEEASFCKQLGYTTQELYKMRERVMAEIDALILLVPQATHGEFQKQITEQIDTLKGDAETAGVWGVVEYADSLLTLANTSQWAELREVADQLALAKRIIFCRINPEVLPTGFLSDDERKAQEETARREQWSNANVLANGPLVDPNGLLMTVDTITDCPIVDSACASFGMYADGQASHLTQLAEVVSKDPGLATQMLICANRLEREGMNAVEDPKLAISLLGEQRLNAISKSLLHIEERHFQSPPFSWPHYWMYLMGVANVAQYTCRAMEFHLAEPVAFTAGLIHDVGKLVLMHLHPHALSAMLSHSRANKITLHGAEHRYLGLTCRDIAIRWAQNSTLAPSCKSVIRWVEEPSKAEADVELVGAVSLARMLCQHNHVGFSGDTPTDRCPPLEETEAWQVLKDKVFPSFQRTAFEHDVHAYCRGLKVTLTGKIH
jgi:CheY-like chemotaxis protein/HD-like signal output (HDOD) protein